MVVYESKAFRLLPKPSPFPLLMCALGGGVPSQSIGFSKSFRRVFRELPFKENDRAGQKRCTFAQLRKKSVVFATADLQIV